MSNKVTIHAAKTQLSRLIARVEAGEEIILARRDKAVAKLVPIRASTPGRKFGAWKGRVQVGPTFFAPLPEDELKAWE